MEKDKCTLTDAELIDKVENIISELAKTGGRSFIMSVPVNFNRDTDMLLSEVVKRFKSKL